MKPQLAAILRHQRRHTTLQAIQHEARQPSPTEQPQSRQQARQTLKQYQSF